MTINNRIELLIKELGLNNNSFSNKIGVNSTVIHNITKGRNSPSFDIMNKIVLTFDNINSEWLLTGEGEMLKDASQQTKKVVQTEVPQKGFELLIEHLKAENKELKTENKELYLQIDRLQNELKNKSC